MYADQPTPPFNSPYQQHASRPNAILQSQYPSPGHADAQSKGPHGLGLYGYQQTMPTGLPSSPQHAEAWNTHYSTAASSLVTEALADPWASGAFDHPVDRSPGFWASTHTSPRSSLSPYTREVSVFSHEDAEPGFPGVKTESQAWDSDVHFGTNVSTEITTLPSRQHLPTVAPERLNTSAYAYGSAYPPQGTARCQPEPVYGFNNRDTKRAPSEASVCSVISDTRSNSASTAGGRERLRSRRHTDPAHTSYRCPLCPEKGFARRYNYNQHILTHDPNRRKDHVCLYPGCGKEFVRKADLTRHDQSIHQQAKNYKCALCPSAFARKDTLRRHDHDGCPRRNQISVANAEMLQQLRGERYAPL